MKTLNALPIAAAALALLAAAQPAHAQKGRAGKKPAAASSKIALGQRPQPGQPCEIGKTYLVGTGANQINVRVDAVELATEYTHKDLAGKPRAEKIENNIHAWLVVRFTVQNLGKKALPIWEETWTSNNAPRTPHLQMNAVRQYVDERDDKPEADFFELYEKDFYRQADGKILDTNGPNDKGNYLQPGQTQKAFAAFQVRKEAQPIVTHLQLNYFGLPTGGGVGVGDPRTADTASQNTLMTFDLKKALGE